MTSAEKAALGKVGSILVRATICVVGTNIKKVLEHQIYRVWKKQLRGCWWKIDVKISMCLKLNPRLLIQLVLLGDNNWSYRRFNLKLVLEL